MAIDTFLVIPGIDGESLDSQHPGAIDVMSWSWGVANSAQAVPLGSGRAAGKATFHSLVISKRFDTASPKLLTACCSGKHFPSATLIVRKAGPDSFDSLNLTLEEMLVSSLDFQQADGEPVGEQLTLTFAKVTMLYTPQRPDGGAGDVVSATWNLRSLSAKE